MLQYLDCSNCQLQCSDVAAVCRVLDAVPSELEELHVACNRIAADGAAAVCAFVAGRRCKLRVLDLAWNSLGERGGVALAAALKQVGAAHFLLPLSHIHTYIPPTYGCMNDPELQFAAAESGLQQFERLRGAGDRGEPRDERGHRRSQLRAEPVQASPGPARPGAARY